MLKTLTKFALVIVVIFLFVWEFFPSVILAPYNNLSPVRTTSTNGQYIIDTNDNEFVEGQNIKIHFEHVELDNEYHTEGASIADINNDGQMDIVTGHYWYEAPNWERHTIRTPAVDAVSIPKLSDHLKIYFESSGEKDIWSRGYPLAFFTFHDDVNKDGWIDVIAVDITSAGFYWFENPKNIDVEWKQHLIMNYTRNESPVFLDLLGTGKPQVITGAADSPSESGKLYAVEFPDEGGFKIHTIEAVNEGRNTGATLPSHGLGIGDIDGDGLNDVLFGSGEGFQDKEGNPSEKQSYDEGGWYRQVIDENGNRSWEWFEIDPSVSFSQMHITDVNNDGRNDFISGMGHGRGLFWFEQTGKNQWKRHIIDDTYTQIHASEMADMDGDGIGDIVAGKTPLAHLGLQDPDEFGTPFLYWYKIIQSVNGEPAFERYLIDDKVGVGRQLTVGDINNDGLPDVVTGSRYGVHIFYQQRN